MKPLLVNDRPINYDAYPNQLNVGGIKRYLENRIPPGGFLTAVLCNDLRGACERADDNNQGLLFEIVSWLYNHAPGGSWGSPERFARWLNDAPQQEDDAAQEREDNSQFGVGA